MRIFNFLLILLISSFLTGCGVSWTDGVRTPDTEDIAKRKNYKVFVDETATINAEKDFLVLAKDLLAKGFESTNTFEVIKDKVTNEDFNPEGFSSFYYEKFDKKAQYNLININRNDALKFMYFTMDTKKTFVKFEDFTINGRSLVSTKKYDNKTEIIKDFFYISNGLYYGLGKDLANKTGYQFFLLDGKGLKENKLVLVPLSKTFSFKQVFDRTLKTYGYQVVQDKESADKIYETEILTYALYKNIKESERKSLMLSPRVDANVNMTSMQLASNLGASNNASASVGLGLLALNMFGTSTNDKIIFSTVAKFYNKGDEKNVNNISILQPQPKEFYGIWDIQEKYIVKESFHGDIGYVSESLIDFMDGGNMRNAYDKIIKKSDKHKVGVVRQVKRLDEL